MVAKAKTSAIESSWAPLCGLELPDHAPVASIYFVHVVLSALLPVGIIRVESSQPGPAKPRYLSSPPRKGARPTVDKYIRTACALMSTPHSTLDLTIVHNASVRHRWTNLWWPASFAHGFAEECSAGDAFGEVEILVWVGNIVLVGGIVLFLFVAHVAVISGLEAVWLSTVRKRSTGTLFSYR